MSIPAIERDEAEREANLFAMCLLMPEKLVSEYVKKNGGADLCDDEWLKRFAKTFGVSMTLASVRLRDLGLFYT